MKSEVSDLVLNAFVDAELPPAEAARIAAVMADNPEIAQKVAHLHRIKAALSAMPDDLVLPAPTQSKQHGWSNLPAMRAVIAGFVLLCGVLWSAPLSGPEKPDIAISFMAEHDQWVAHGGAQTKASLPGGFDWIQPVMNASGLRLVHYSAAGSLQHFGFKGVNTCRMSLFVTQKASAMGPLQLSLTDKVQHAQWQLDTVSFEMIARDMARQNPRGPGPGAGGLPEGYVRQLHNRRRSGQRAVGGPRRTPSPPRPEADGRRQAADHRRVGLCVALWGVVVCPGIGARRTGHCDFFHGTTRSLGCAWC